MNGVGRAFYNKQARGKRGNPDAKLICLHIHGNAVYDLNVVLTSAQNARGISQEKRKNSITVFKEKEMS